MAKAEKLEQNRQGRKSMLPYPYCPSRPMPGLSLNRIRMVDRLLLSCQSAEQKAREGKLRPWQPEEGTGELEVGLVSGDRE